MILTREDANRMNLLYKSICHCNTISKQIEIWKQYKFSGQMEVHREWIFSTNRYEIVMYDIGISPNSFTNITSPFPFVFVEYNVIISHFLCRLQSLFFLLFLSNAASLFLLVFMEYNVFYFPLFLSNITSLFLYVLVKYNVSFSLCFCCTQRLYFSSFLFNVISLSLFVLVEWNVSISLCFCRI